MTGRDRERETERDTDRETETHRDTERETALTGTQTRIQSADPVDGSWSGKHGQLDTTPCGK